MFKRRRPAAGPGFGTELRKLRNARKHSQLAMAEIAGTSQRHLSFLESGRSQPSREMVLQISHSLRLSLREQNRLLLLAGFAPQYPQRDLESADMEPVRQALERQLRHHDPYPAIVIDRQWNMVLVNDAVVNLFKLVGDQDTVWNRVCPDGHRNVLRMLFHPQGLRPYIHNFSELLRLLLTRLQREAAESSGAASLLEAMLKELKLPLRQEAVGADVAPSPVFSIHLHAGGVSLRLFAMFSTFGTPQDVTADELRVSSFYPVDAESESILRGLAPESTASAPS